MILRKTHIAKIKDKKKGCSEQFDCGLVPYIVIYDDEKEKFRIGSIKNFFHFTKKLSLKEIFEDSLAEKMANLPGFEELLSNYSIWAINGTPKNIKTIHNPHRIPDNCRQLEFWFKSYDNLEESQPKKLFKVDLKSGWARQKAENIFTKSKDKNGVITLITSLVFNLPKELIQPLFDLQEKDFQIEEEFVRRSIRISIQKVVEMNHPSFTELNMKNRNAKINSLLTEVVNELWETKFEQFRENFTLDKYKFTLMSLSEKFVNVGYS